MAQFFKVLLLISLQWCYNNSSRISQKQPQPLPADFYVILHENPFIDSASEF